MGKLVAIFFGNANITIYAQDETTGAVEPVRLEGICSTFTINTSRGVEEMYPVPAMVCFDADRTYYGQEIRAFKKFRSPNTFRYMKQFMAKDRHLPRIINGQEISIFQAAEALMITVIDRIIQLYGSENISMFVFPLPPAGYDIFAAWIEDICFRFGLVNFKLVDCGVCSLLAYGLGHELGTNFMYVLFGATTLDLYILKVEETGSEPRLKSVVLGGTSKNYGSIDVDKAIQLAYPDHGMNLKQAERIKLHLAAKPLYEETVNDRPLRITRDEMHQLLDDRGYGAELKLILTDLIDLASGIGVTYESVQYVLCAGPSIALPYYNNIMKSIFGAKMLDDRAHNDIPLGALAYLRHQDSGSTIRANYALRSRTAKGDGYKYDIIIPKGTPYPTHNGVTTIIANGFFDGQQEVALDIFRMDVPETTSDREIVMADDGRLQIEENLPDEQRVFINEAQPDTIKLDPPVRSGERRFEITFDVSINKDLLITVKDLRRNIYIWQRKKSIRLD
jgi:hypothetical protein